MHTPCVNAAQFVFHAEREGRQCGNSRHYIPLETTGTIHGCCPPAFEQRVGNFVSFFVACFVEETFALLSSGTERQSWSISASNAMQDVVERLKKWESEGRIMGVLDKTKYLVLTADELSRISTLIRERGRWTLSELVAAVNDTVRVEKLC
jgi:hypothetical protein